MNNLNIFLCNVISMKIEEDVKSSRVLEGWIL
jgi:hypothetical protein